MDKNAAALAAGIENGMEKVSSAESLAANLAVQGLGGLVGHHYGTKQRKRKEEYGFGVPQAAGALLLPGGLGYQIGRYYGHHPGGPKAQGAKRSKKGKRR